MIRSTEKPTEVIDPDVPELAEPSPDEVENLPTCPRQNRRQPDLLHDSLAYAIKRSQVRCDEALSSYLKAGLSPARFAALSTVGANPGISQTTLGKALDIGGAAVVKVVNDLERMRLVQRLVCVDRRFNALELTDHGLAELKEYQASIRQYEKKIAAQLTSKERAILLELLSRVASNEA